MPSHRRFLEIKVLPHFVYEIWRDLVVVWVGCSYDVEGRAAFHRRHNRHGEPVIISAHDGFNAGHFAEETHDRMRRAQGHPLENRAMGDVKIDEVIAAMTATARATALLPRSERHLDGDVRGGKFTRGSISSEATRTLLASKSGDMRTAAQCAADETLRQGDRVVVNQVDMRELGLQPRDAVMNSLRALGWRGPVTIGGKRRDILELNEILWEMQI